MLMKILDFNSEGQRSRLQQSHIWSKKHLGPVHSSVYLHRFRFKVKVPKHPKILNNAALQPYHHLNVSGMSCCQSVSVHNISENLRIIGQISRSWHGQKYCLETIPSSNCNIPKIFQSNRFTGRMFSISKYQNRENIKVTVRTNLSKIQHLATYLSK